MKKLTRSKAQNMLTFIIRTPSIGTARQSAHSRMSSAQNECKIQSLQKAAKHKRKSTRVLPRNDFGHHRSEAKNKETDVSLS